MIDCLLRLGAHRRPPAAGAGLVRGRLAGLNSSGGAVLLEVIIALAIFISAAAVMVGATTASVNAARKLRLEAQAADLAVTQMSQIQMGVYPPASDGPTPFEDPLKDWSWQIVADTPENPPQGLPEFKRVQVVITYTPTGFSYRLTELFPPAASDQPQPDQTTPTDSTDAAAPKDTGVPSDGGGTSGTGRGSGPGSGSGSGSGRGRGSGTGARGNGTPPPSTPPAGGTP